MANNIEDIRWKQRFENFKNAYKQFSDAVSCVDQLSVLEKEGMIQRFEYTFELAWKTLKDFLEAQNVDAAYPRQVIKKAFEYEIIEDGETWLEMLEQRNLMAHTYSEEIFIKAVQLICGKYFQAIEQVYRFLLKE
ncbi:MAG: nucleotidyltransferase substrate binding protein [Proteobacteria bacterium]|nr:nucleotidyltransferase substrate binding protein [Pseudomonadota bacterium]MBU2628859.1 nucleotidyltransferase substrate binding protein [Pseudomonadota bacterium]